MLTLKTMQHGLLRDEIGENNATKKKGFKTNNNKKNEDQI
jgi:hypothetical protein